MVLFNDSSFVPRMYSLHYSIIIGVAIISLTIGKSTDAGPIVINTWPFTVATATAFETLSKGGSAMDAVVNGCTRCEMDQCDHTVGFGGSPDESGETSLDALLIDGDTLNVGAVANLRRVRDAIKTARLVLEKTHHSILAGDEATAFASQFGIKVYDTLATDESKRESQKWKERNCQPNFWKKDAGLAPDPATHCGPYHNHKRSGKWGNEYPSQPRSHDTISMIAVDGKNSIVAGSSTNGLKHKIPGRVGDAAVPGGSAYADSKFGACAATGDGDTHLRFLPCFHVYMNLRSGMHIQQATDDAMARILSVIGHDTGFQGAVVAFDARTREIGATSVGNWNFSYSYQDQSMLKPRVVLVDAFHPHKSEH